jgi:hypothetical protein
MKWIDVKERLPKVRQNVLLYTGLEPTDDFMIGCLNEQGWFWDEEANYMSVPVTHWMPLPSPPNLSQPEKNK